MPHAALEKQEQKASFRVKPRQVEKESKVFRRLPSHVGSHSRYIGNMAVQRRAEQMNKTGNWDIYGRLPTNSHPVQMTKEEAHKWYKILARNSLGVQAKLNPEMTFDRIEDMMAYIKKQGYIGNKHMLLEKVWKSTPEDFKTIHMMEMAGRKKYGINTLKMTKEPKTKTSLENPKKKLSIPEIMKAENWTEIVAEIIFGTEEEDYGGVEDQLKNLIGALLEQL